MWGWNLLITLNLFVNKFVEKKARILCEMLSFFFCRFVSSKGN